MEILLLLTNFKQTILDVKDEELAKRRNKWSQPKLKVDFGSLYKYAKIVSSASKGCVTDEF